MDRLKPLKSWLRRISLVIWLGFVSFLLIITVSPLIATERSHSSTVQQVVTTSQLIEEGKKRFEAGKFFEAVEFWQQAERFYHVRGDRLNHALSLNYLSLGFQQLGKWEEAKKAIATSLNLLSSFPKLNREANAVFAQALNTQGKLQLATGQAEAALDSWQMAERIYQRSQDLSGALGSQINQAQALQTLGLYRRSQTILEQATAQLQTETDSTLKIVGLRSLGTVWLALGQFTKAEEVLQQSLALARELNLSAEIGANFFSLGNVKKALQDIEGALQFYQQAAEIAPSPIASLEARVNQFSSLIDLKRWREALVLFDRIEPSLANITASRSVIFARVNLATKLMELQSRGEISAQAIADILAKAVQQAKQIKDSRAESYAIGQLGALYERNGLFREAQNLTSIALSISQQIQAEDITYRWEWQLGRLYDRQGSRKESVAAYRESVAILQSIRKDLMATSSDVEFSFKQSIEPIYRELVKLLVQGDFPTQEDLQQARQAIEELQLAELENFFRSACIDVHTKQIDRLDRSAAIVYPIILTDRLAVILSLPGKELSVYTTFLPKQEIIATLEQALGSLNPIFPDGERVRLFQLFYDWLIRPAETELSANQIETLVFVLDSELRSLPMSALYDGQKYLVEKYNIGISLGLQLLETPEIAEKQKLQAVIGGLAEARHGFVALPGVLDESKQIAAKLPAKLLLDRNFTKQNLVSQIKQDDYPLVHLATHGRFSSKQEDTFILTWDERLTIEDLRVLLRSRSQYGTRPIELLVLSACETAEGDSRAILGLAGLAVRSGARSTLATLWSVNDASTAVLMKEFYQAFVQTRSSKVKSLRQAQLELIHSSEYNHPYYWAPFILVGNWL